MQSLYHAVGWLSFSGEILLLKYQAVLLWRVFIWYSSKEKAEEDPVVSSDSMLDTGLSAQCSLHPECCLGTRLIGRGKKWNTVPYLPGCHIVPNGTPQICVSSFADRALRTVLGGCVWPRMAIWGAADIAAATTHPCPDLSLYQQNLAGGQFVLQCRRHGAFCWLNSNPVAERLLQPLGSRFVGIPGGIPLQLKTLKYRSSYCGFHQRTGAADIWRLLLAAERELCFSYNHVFCLLRLLFYFALFISQVQVH